MDHERATTLIADHARGRLGATLAADLERHLQGCDECRQAWEASAALEAEIRSRGPEFLATHPSAEDVAAYAVLPESLAQTRLAAIALHIRACPICEAEAATARRALKSAWWRGWRAAVFGTEPQTARALLAPALAVLAVALLYPAYLGTVRYPAALRERDRAAVAADSLRALRDAGIEPSIPLAPYQGGIGSIVLTGPSRESRPSVPVARPRADQPFLHVVIDHPVAVEARRAGRRMDITVFRSGEPMPVWHVEGEAAALWDEGLHAAGFVVPADRLAPGTYRLELRSGSEEPAFVAEFQIAESAP